MADISSPSTAEAENNLVSRLVDEYKILQDKIDKIGAFRFTIKGWSITVLIASIFAGSTTKTVPRWLWAISLLIFLVVFFSYEKQQTDLRYRFGQRVLSIEEVLSRLLRNLAHASKSESVVSSFLTLRFVPGIGRVGPRTERKSVPRNFWRSCKDADAVFYLVQVAVVLLAFVFWPGGAPPHDDTKSGSITINNAVPDGTAESVRPAKTKGPRKNTSSAVGANEKDSKKTKEHESH
jgi:hypothetical protein